LFDRDAGQLHGLRHYTPGGTCACLICRERGHGQTPIPPAIPAETIADDVDTTGQGP
jgi:hypothetical protein